VFVVSSMLAMGLGQRLSDIIGALRSPRRVALALFASFVLAPALALILTRAVPLQPPHAIGLLLLAGSAGSAFLPRLAQLCGGNLAEAVALMVLLMTGTIIFDPLVLPWLVPGLPADPLRIAKPLLVLLLLPLAAGFALRATAAGWVPKLQAWVERLSNLAFVVVAVLMVGLNLGVLASTLGSYAIGTYALFVLSMMCSGHLLGRFRGPSWTVFALAGAQRNIPAALVLSDSFEDPAVTVMVLVGSVVGLLVLLSLAWLLGRDFRQQGFIR
jgi:BASS family bile acid:Na+ symporter